MNDKERQAIKARQKRLVATMTADDDDTERPEPPPPPPPWDPEEIILQMRGQLPAGVPVRFLRFSDKSFQVPGMQSGETLTAKVQSAGREHRIEYIEQIRHHLITWIDAAKREVKFAFVPEAHVKAWEPA